MRIIPIINTDIRSCKSCKGGNVAQNSAYLYLSALSSSFDSVSFKAQPVMSAKAFKKLSNYMVDLYTGGEMLTDTNLCKMKRRGLFKGNISLVIAKLRPYKEKYLEPIELAVFEIMEREAIKHPQLTMNEIFNSLFFKALKKIENAQKPLFDHMKALGCELPEGYARKFADYMAIVDKKIKGEPVLREFSHKEFTYKLTKLSNNVTDKGLVSQIKDLINLVEGKEERNIFKRIINRIFRKNTNFSDKLSKIEAIENLKSSASHKGYKRIERLCADNIDMLKGVPVYVPFSNKAFTYDINKMLENLPDTRTKREILLTARALPNSMSSTDALILKFKDSEPNAIGERLFSPSVVSLEHLEPQSKGGPTNIANCALARRGPNSKRGNEPLYITLQKYPRKNQQKYVNRLTALVKRGLINAQDALSQIRTIEDKGHITLKKDKLLKLIQAN